MPERVASAPFHLFFALVVGLGASACAARTTSLENAGATRTDDDAIAAALADAERADDEEVARDLIALVPDEGPAEWRRDESGEAWVRLVTWTDWEGYRALVGQRVPNGRTIWVTAAPEVQAFCRASGLEGQSLAQRLVQHLGLRPGTGKAYFVTMWARPSEVLRPCADADVSDRTCDNTEVADDVRVGDHDHRAWFDDLRARSYVADGYPWTRLGYTYDWAPDASERGASEFLIPAGVAVEIEALTPTDEYCR